jgi:hypothetical protein
MSKSSIACDKRLVRVCFPKHIKKLKKANKKTFAQDLRNMLTFSLF